MKAGLEGKFRLEMALARPGDVGTGYAPICPVAYICVCICSVMSSALSNAQCIFCSAIVAVQCTAPHLVGLEHLYISKGFISLHFFVA